MLLFLLLQAAAAPAPAPDIQLDARVTAREVRIRQSGETSLEVRGGPGSEVRVDKPRGQAGRQRLRNVTVTVHAEARIADPRQNPGPAETASPQ
ncbi:MAG: hypothetical protein QOD42_3024 [Sphingomonadales bacterium]|jgi:hypothetical protein|nr:hypothetical protein [Sphingomonadales bacterium]